MAKTVSGPPRRPPGPGAGTASRGSKTPSARAGGGAAGRTGRVAGLFAARRRGPGAGRGRRRPGGKALLFAAVGATIVAAMAWALLGSRLLVVRSVQVVGAGRAVPVAQVLAAAHVLHGMPLIRVNTGAIARHVEQLRQVQFATVSKDWPSTVVITVTPRTAVFAVGVAGGYALVDRFGVSIRDVASQPAGLPLISVGPPGVTLRGNPAVWAAAVVLTELPPRIAGKVRGVSATSSSDVSLTLANGSVVIWGSTAQAKQKAEELTVLMHRHARSYDVSAPGTAVTQG
jgi:cell division protein FtsQ